MTLLLGTSVRRTQILVSKTIMPCKEPGLLREMADSRAGAGNRR